MNVFEHCACWSDFEVGRVGNEQYANEWTVFSEAKVMIIQSMETIVGVVRHSYSAAGGFMKMNGRQTILDRWHGG